jgi:predicted metal-dependent phosphoesterase TrpH
LPSTKQLTKDEIAAILESDVRKDLHLHTFYSDGRLSPHEIIDRWASEGYELIAITDHDGIDGSVVGWDYAAEKGIGYIQGIEFDSADKLGRDMHILGYGFDYNSPELRDALDTILLERAARNDAMLAAIRDLGYDITMDDIIADNEGRYIGKPTFARVLARKGYVENANDAFATIFREPTVRVIRKKTFSSEEVIRLIHAAGGLAVLAHPMEQRHLEETYNQFTERLYPILNRMREYGIDGIECYHPSADEVQAEVLREYAEAHGLVVTAGSDFHTDYQKRDFTRYHRP